MKVLVTGGCGFIGSNLTHELARIGWDVDVVDDMSNGHLEFLEGLSLRVVPTGALAHYEKEYEEEDNRDILIMTGDFAADDVLARIRSGKYDVVFHLAANPRVEYSVKFPVHTTEVNVFKTVALFKVCVDSKTRVVFSSSSAVYGDAESLPVREATRGLPQSPYGLQKLVGEQYADIFCRLYDADIVCLRYFNVYGPRQLGDSAYSTAVSAWCNAIFNQNSLRSDGDGTQTRDMIYVGDVVEANVKAAIAGIKFTGQALNIATGVSISNNEILKMFEEHFPEAEVAHAPRRPGDVMHTLADTELAESTIDFKAKTDFNRGLVQTLMWWKEEAGNG
jgi:nucleoside-diphosphate-sugar epimerase